MTFNEALHSTLEAEIKKIIIDNLDKRYIEQTLSNFFDEGKFP